MSSPLNVYKGPENKMADVGIEDGQLFFATDTKTIYLDCDFKDGNGELVQGRFPFGGGTGRGVLFAEADFEPTESQFFFTLNNMDVAPGEKAKLPGLDNVIFNIADGYFYRVVEVFDNQVEAERLNAVGSGGGGTGEAMGISATMITSPTVHAESTVKSLPIILAAHSRAENAALTAVLKINNREVHTFESIPQSKDKETNLFTFDVMNYKQYLTNNIPNDILIELSDSTGFKYRGQLLWKVTLYNISLNIVTNEDEMGTQYGPFFYRVLPDVPYDLLDPKINYEIIFEAQNSITEKGSKNLNRGASTEIDIPISAGALRAAGSYRINMWLSATIASTNQEIITSTISSSFIYQIKGSEQATLQAEFPKGGTYNLYESGIITRYKLFYGSPVKVRKTLLIQTNSDIIPIDEGTDILEPYIWYTWNISLAQEGIYTFKLELLDSNNSILQTLQNSGTFIVKQNSEDMIIPTIATNNLLINLVPNKTNASVDKENWISDTEYGDEYRCKLTGFNWTSNGWETENFVNDSGEIKTVNCLHLNNGAKVEIPYNPWAPSSINSKYGAEGTGLTIEFDVKIKNIQNRSSHLISCASEEHREDGTYKLYTGLITNGEAFTLNSKVKRPIEEIEDPKIRFTDKTKSGLVAYYEEDSRIHVSYVITPRSVNSTVAHIIPSRIIYTYINGVISGITNYAEDDAFLQDGISQDKIPSVIFDSSNADIYIYNFRVYNAVLNSETILRNYLATLGDLQTSADKWKKNNILENSTISFGKFKSQNNNIPYLVIRGGQRCEKNKTTKKYEAIAGGEVGLPYIDKYDYRLIDAYFVDPENPKYNIGSINNRAQMIMYPQGTSSLVYPVKNLRIAFTDGQTYSLMDGLPEIDLFCLKADYMESSGSHNTGAANALNSLYEAIDLKTPAQELNPNYVTAIKGRPIVVFYKAMSEADRADNSIADQDSDYIFVGKYNFNLDKKTPEPFGFYSDIENKYGVVLDKDGNPKGGFIASSGKQEKGRTYYTAPNFDSVWDNSTVDWDTYIKTVGPLYEYHEPSEGINSIQCWEVATNTGRLVRFQDPWYEMPFKIEPDAGDIEAHKEWEEYEALRAKNITNWTDSFESRYPEYEEEVCSDKRGITRLINWLASTNLIEATNKPLTEGMDKSPIDPTTGLQTHYGYTTDTKAYRNQKFKQEAQDYLNIDFMTFYYIMTEVNFMIDSRAKNMMLCSFDQDMDAGTGHWFPIFYDMDTQLGIDNEGKIRFLYDDEDYEPAKFNALADYTNNLTGLSNNVLPSILWTNFKNNFQTNIKEMYERLRNSALTPKNLLSIFNDGQADAWDEVFCNQDAQYKYLNPFLSGEMTEEFEKFDDKGESLNAKSANRLYAAQGTRSIHRSKYIKNRIEYLDSKYQYSNFPFFQFRLQPPLDANVAGTTPEKRATFNLTARNTFYLNYRTELTDAIKFKARLEEGESTDVLFDELVNISQEQSLYLYSGNAYTNLGDISMKYPSSMTWETDKNSEKNKLITIQLSPKDLDREYYNETASDAASLADLNIIEKSPLIEELWIRNMRYSSTLNLSNNYYLKKLYAGGTGLTGVTFPNGGVLEYVELPSTVIDVNIKGHETLSELHILTHRNEVTNEYPRNSENWSRIKALSIEDCPALDTKSIFEAITADKFGIYLPDIDWTITLDECVIGVPEFDENGNPTDNIAQPNIIYEIPILEKLINTPRANGDISDIGKLNRTYVKGIIRIENDATTGIDEVLLYEKYQKYYPGLTFVTADSTANIKGYSFNVYSTTSDLLTEYSKKYRENEVIDKFTLGKTFGGEKIGDTVSDILIPIQSLNLAPRYETKFIGWNLNMRQEFREDTYNKGSIEDNIAEAYKEAQAATAILYDPLTNSYYPNSNFNFATAFNDNTSTLNFYPTFVAIVQEYNVTFYDGLNNNNNGYGDIIPVTINSILQESQKVRHGEYPIMPDIIPQKLDLLDDVKETRVYEFVNYNQMYTKDNPPQISGATQLKAYYKNTYVHIRTIPSSESYFEFAPGGSNGVYIKIANGCDQPALTIPNTYKGDRVIGLMPSTNTVRRIYCMDGNTISVIGDDFKREDKQFEYFDFAYLRNDNISIGARAFQNCIMLQGDVLPDPMGMIDIKTSAFDGCEKLSISYLPSQLMILENYVFRNCYGITNFSFNNSSNLTKIGRDCFRDCTNLQLIDNSLNNLSIISDYAFRGCSKLNAVIDNTSKITEVGSNAFELSTVTLNALPDNLKKVQADGFAFIASPKICQVGFIPNTITKIGDRAFSGLTFDVDEVVFDDGITLVKPANDPNAKDIDYGMGASAFSGANIRAIRLPSDAITTKEPWATGLATSWGATTNGYTKTPVITN